MHTAADKKSEAGTGSATEFQFRGGFGPRLVSHLSEVEYCVILNRLLRITTKQKNEANI